MVGLKKRGVITAVAGILAAVTITGCSAAPDNDATVVTVGTEKVSYGVANFYARMQQAQYESFYAGLMGMSADTMWSQEVEEGKTYEENMKDSILESLENMYLVTSPTFSSASAAFKRSAFSVLDSESNVAVCTSFSAEAAAAFMSLSGSALTVSRKVCAFSFSAFFSSSVI